MMQIRNAWARLTVAATLTAFVLGGLPQPARAGMIGTEAVSGVSTRADQLTRARALMARADVRARLTAMGIDAAEAAQRVEALSDADLERVASLGDRLPAGGDLGVLEVIGVVFIVLLVIDLSGTAHIFRH